jgi:DNA-directed RNA polymerase subunit K/omega
MTNKLNKFELTVLISARANELANGAKPKVSLDGFDMSKVPNYSEIAKKEFEEGVLDLEIYRKEYL